MKEREFDRDEDGFFEWLKIHRLESPDVCLGYHLKRVAREHNLDQVSIADRTAVNGQPPLTRSFISAMLSGRSGVRPDSWLRLADALDTNVIEFYLAEQWLTPSDIAAYQVPHAARYADLTALLDKVPDEVQRAAIALCKAVLETVIQQQKTNTKKG